MSADVAKGEPATGNSHARLFGTAALVALTAATVSMYADPSPELMGNRIVLPEGEIAVEIYANGEFEDTPSTFVRIDRDECLSKKTLQEALSSVASVCKVLLPRAARP
uniref:Uncharacterized protein n=1 Tax=Phaeomonas parva TaxID=124430 RepID=A0A7S1TTA2_9STRA|mmetsp:Transcript_16897/g.51933  ORF Transcript_16897/g.51933 Transcript_16897/m.51933 type:complete len:108 (+) Transcript_16897:258-581(+)